MLFQKLKDVIKPNENWGPLDPADKEDWMRAKEATVKEDNYGENIPMDEQSGMVISP